MWVTIWTILTPSYLVCPVFSLFSHVQASHIPHRSSADHWRWYSEDEMPTDAGRPKLFSRALYSHAQSRAQKSGRYARIFDKTGSWFIHVQRYISHQVPPVLRNFCGYIADQSYHRIYISRSDISQYINESKATSAWGHSLGVFSYSLVFVLSFGWTGHIFSSLCESIWLRLGLAQSGEDN